MDISPNNQLVPYYHGSRPITPYSQRVTGAVSTDGHSAAKRYVLMPPSHSPGYSIQTGNRESIYTSSRRIKVQEINQIGALIDIYA